MRALSGGHFPARRQGHVHAPRHSAPSRKKTQSEFIKKYDLSGFKYLFLAGERLDPTRTTGRTNF